MDKVHGPSPQGSGRCSQLLAAHSSNVRASAEGFAAGSLLQAGDGVAPHCRNAFAANRVRFRHVGVRQRLHADASPNLHRSAGLGSGRSGMSSLDAVSDLPSWELASTTSTGTVEVRRPPRSMIPHATSKAILAEWDVERRIEQHEREEALLGEQDTRRTTGCVLCCAGMCVRACVHLVHVHPSYVPLLCVGLTHLRLMPACVVPTRP